MPSPLSPGRPARLDAQSLDEARELAREHTLVPLRHTFIADTETPVSAYLKLRGDGPSFLLESAEQGQRFGRWSFLGYRPRTVIRLEDGVLTVGGEARDVRRPLRGRRPRSSSATGSRRSRACRRSPAAPWACSATTWCAAPSPPWASGNPDALGTPDMALMVTDVLVAFDHLRHEVTILANVFAEDDVDGRLRRRPSAAIAEVRERLAAPVPRAHAGRREPPGLHEQHRLGRLRRGGRAVQGVHPRRRRLPGGAEPALERRRPGRGVLDLPRPARDQPQPVHVLPRLRGLRDRRRLARVAGQGHGPPRRAAPDRRHAAARRHRRRGPPSAPRSCWPTRRSAPST